MKLECPRCGYALAALPDEGVCPECGRAYDPELLRRYAAYRTSMRWFWIFAIGWPVLMLGSLAILGSLNPLQASVSLLDRHTPLLIMVVSVFGALAPLYVVLFRIARLTLKYGDSEKRIYVCSIASAAVAMLPVYLVWSALSSDSIERINPFLLLILISVLNCVLAYSGSIIGERIGVRLSRGRS